MRTYEDVKEALEYYKEELKREATTKRDHYIVVGGNMCVIRKGVGQYALGKGDPIPMVWETAKKKVEEFQEKCCDGVKLESVKYNDWLNNNIIECNKLIECMKKSLSGEDANPTNPTNPTDQPDVSEIPDSDSRISECPIQSEKPVKPNYSDCTPRPVEVSCQTCPYGVKNCMICRFATGINMDTFPWEVICSAPGEIVNKT